MISASIVAINRGINSLLPVTNHYIIHPPASNSKKLGQNQKVLQHPKLFVGSRSKVRITAHSTHIEPTHQLKQVKVVSTFFSEQAVLPSRRRVLGQ
jgi:hypothetical protein